MGSRPQIAPNQGRRAGTIASGPFGCARRILAAILVRIASLQSRLTTLDGAPDADLVAAALLRDEAACVCLFRRHAPRVMRALRVGFQLSPAEAEDVMQESFVRGFRNLAQLRQPDRFGFWMMAIARSEALGSLQRGTHRRRTELAVAAEAATVVEQAAPEEPAVGVVRKLLHELEDGPERRLIHRFYVDGDCTVQQLADELGLAKGTVTSQLTRFRARIKRRLVALLAASGSIAEPSEGGR